MIKLGDWNKCLTAAKKAASIMSEKNHMDIRATAYRISNNEKGITYQLYDCDGNLYWEVPSGVCSSAEELMNTLKSNADRVKTML